MGLVWRVHYILKWSFKEMRTIRSLALCLPLILISQASIAHATRYEKLRSECLNVVTENACVGQTFCEWQDGACQIAGEQFARETYSNCFVLATGLALAIVIPVACLAKACRMLR
jgi:hypothetical protein